MTDALRSIPYVNDILNQPEALRQTLAAFAGESFAGLSSLAAELRSGRLRRLVLTGMGSSYHALYPLFYGLLAAGLPAQMVETSELIHHASGLLSPDNLLVAVSQSGASAETLQLLEKAPAGARLVGVTNTPDSPLARRADALLLTCAGTESTVSCKTYVTALAGLALLEAALCGHGPERTLEEFQAAPEALAAYLGSLEDHLAELEEALRETRSLVLAGRGRSLAAAGTGGLIIKEAAHFPAEGMSSAAFRHGPLEMTSPQTFVLVFEGLEPTRALNRNLVDEILQAGGKAALVETSPDRTAFHLPPVAPAILPILEILPAQLVSLALARLQGRVPGQFTLGSKVTRTE